MVWCIFCLTFKICAKRNKSSRPWSIDTCIYYSITISTLWFILTLYSQGGCLAVTTYNLLKTWTRATAQSTIKLKVTKSIDNYMIKFQCWWSMPITVFMLVCSTAECIQFFIHLQKWQDNFEDSIHGWKVERYLFGGAVKVCEDKKSQFLHGFD